VEHLYCFVAIATRVVFNLKTFFLASLLILSVFFKFYFDLVINLFLQVKFSQVQRLRTITHSEGTLFR
jgi:hypothetical protein